MNAFQYVLSFRAGHAILSAMDRRFFTGGMLAAMLARPAQADPMMIADFSTPDIAENWRFFTDQVMGGVSTGRAEIADGALTLSGRVSTQNNGGFIQARSDRIAMTPDVTRLRLSVRGDGQRYFIHLRTRATRLPWQYYQAGFIAPADWTDIILSLSDFEPSGRLLPATPAPEHIRSVALVAFGRDHEARVSMRRIHAE